MTTARSYLVGFATTFVAGAMLVSATNYFVDPYFLYHHGSTRYLNVEKPRFGNRRTFMPIYIDRHASDVVVLGSSRSTATFNALAATWPNEKMQDAGVSALRVREAIEYMTMFASRPEIKTIVYQPDFFSFNRNYLYHGTFVPTVVGEGRLWRLQMLAIFGLSSFRASLETISVNLRNGTVPAPIAQNGEGATGPQPNVEEMRRQFRYQLDAFSRSPEFYSNLDLDTEVMSSLAATFRRVVSSGKKLIVLIGPSHALQWEDIRRTSNWEKFEAWKRAMAGVADDTGIPIWDFASFSPISTLPVDESARAWYADSSHFTKKTAQLAINCVLSGQDCDKVDGAPLTRASVEDRLRTIREKRLRWLERRGIQSDLELLPPPAAQSGGGARSYR